MRKAITFAHRWIGLIAGAYILLIAFSGIGMVFSTSFWALEYGEGRVSVPVQDQPYAGPDIWLEKAEQRFGAFPNVEGFFGPRATPMRISAPTIIYTPERATDAHGIVTVDPYNGEPLAHFVAEDSWSMLPLTLHLSLFLPPAIASWALVVASVVLVGFGLSGLYLWWPGKGRMRTALAIARPTGTTGLRRFHAAIGFWSSPLIILAGLTGLLLARFDVAEAVTAPFGASAEYDPTKQVASVCAPRTPVTAGEALATARGRYPGRELGAMFLPRDDANYFDIWLRPANSTVPARGDAQVIVDAKCGTVLFSRAEAEMKPGDVILTYLVELHNGRLLGLPGEALIFLQGVAISILPLAGIVLWFRRRTIRRSNRAMRDGMDGLASAPS